MITINYNIADPDISKSISSYRTQIQSIKDLKEKIASDLHIDESNIIIQNPPKEEEFKKDFITNIYIDIELINFKHDIEFYFTKNKKVEIKNAYNKNFKKIIKELEKNGYYFSKSCIKEDFELYSDGKKLSDKEDYPFIFISTYVEIRGDYVILEYFDKNFFFSDSEKAKKAYKMIDETFWDCDDVFIFNEYKQIVNKSDYLYCEHDYEVRLQYLVGFYTIDRNYKLKIPFNSVPTVSDAKTFLSNAYSNPFNILTPESFIIYDRHMKKIKKNKKYLYQAQDIDKPFYFGIKMPTLNHQKKQKKVKKKSKDDFKQENEKVVFDNSFQEEEEIGKLINSLINEDEENEKLINSLINEDVENERKSIDSKTDDQLPIKKDKKTKPKIKMPSVKITEISDDHKNETNSFLLISFISENKDFQPLKKSVPVSVTIKEIEKMIEKNFSIKKKMNIKYLLDGKKVVVNRNTRIEEIRDKIQQKENNEKVVNKLFVEFLEEDENEIDDSVDKNQKNQEKREKYDEDDGNEDNPKKPVKKKLPKSLFIPKIKPERNENLNNDEIESKNAAKETKKKLEKPSKSYDDESEEENSRPKRPVSKKSKKSFTPKKSDENKKSYDEETEIENEEEDSRPKKPVKKPKSRDESESENDDSDDEYNPKKPAKPKPTKSKTKKQSKSSDDDDENSNNDSDIFKKQTIEKIKFDDDDDDDESKSDVDDDDDDEYQHKQTAKKKPTKSSFMPKKKEIDQSPSKEQEYQFDYNGNIKKIPIENDSTFSNEEKTLKKAFKLDKNQQIKFIVLNKNGDEQEIKDKNQKLQKYKNAKSIKIVLLPKQKDEKKSDKFTIKYKTNNDNEVNDAELNKDATVKTLKEYIQIKYKVKNLANIKVIFAGKELLNDIALKPMNIGDTVLFIYIRTEQDIFLLTARALQYGNDDSSSSS